MPSKSKTKSPTENGSSLLQFMISPISPRQAHEFRQGVDNIKRKSKKSLTSVLTSISAAYLHPPKQAATTNRNPAIERIGKNWRAVLTQTERVAIMRQYYTLYDGRKRTSDRSTR